MREPGFSVADLVGITGLSLGEEVLVPLRGRVDSKLPRFGGSARGKSSGLGLDGGRRADVKLGLSMLFLGTDILPVCFFSLYCVK